MFLYEGMVLSRKYLHMTPSVVHPEGWKDTPVGKLVLLASSKEVSDEQFEDAILSAEISSENDLEEICLAIIEHRPSLHAIYQKLPTVKSINAGF